MSGEYKKKKKIQGKASSTTYMRFPEHTKFDGRHPQESHS